MQELIIIQDLSIVMVVSAITVVLCRLLHLPLVLGYILAGLLIGPHTPPYSFVKDVHGIHTLSTLGVIFLMFTIGLEFNLSKLAKVGVTAILTAVLEITFMICLGFGLGKAFHWSSMDSLFLGAILAISSTTIIAKILLETKKQNEKFAQVILGILVIEDLLAIVIIAVLSGIAVTGSLNIGDISWAMLKVSMFVMAVLIGGFFLVPRILTRISQFQSHEMMIIMVLGFCLGVSFLAVKFGFSAALGAFLIGAIIAETKQAHAVVIKMESIRDMFTAIFFVSVGMLIDPALLAAHWLPVLIIVVLTVIGKVFACSLAVFLAGNKSDTALKVGLGLAQIGEFSFIIAQLGQTAQVTSSFLYPVAVCVCALTTITTPFLMNHSESITAFIKRLVPAPIATVAHTYTPWVAKISQGGINAQGRSLVLKGLLKRLPLLIFYIGGLCSIYWAGVKFRADFAFSDVLYWGLVTACMFPFLIGCAYTADKIIWEDLFLNLIKAKNIVSDAKNAGSMLHNAFRFLASLLMGLVFIIIVSFFIPHLPVPAAILIVLVISSIFLWRSIRHTHEHFEGMFLSIFERTQTADKEQSKEFRKQFVELMSNEDSLEFETQDIVLPHYECAVNTSIVDLNLRAQTGASIVAIYRDTQSIANPSAQTTLLPGDVLLIMGSQQQLKSAIAYLQDKMKTST